METETEASAKCPDALVHVVSLFLKFNEIEEVGAFLEAYPTLDTPSKLQLYLRNDCFLIRDRMRFFKENLFYADGVTPESRCDVKVVQLSVGDNIGKDLLRHWIEAKEGYLYRRDAADEYCDAWRFGQMCHNSSGVSEEECIHKLRLSSGIDDDSFEFAPNTRMTLGFNCCGDEYLVYWEPMDTRLIAEVMASTPSAPMAVIFGNFDRSCERTLHLFSRMFRFCVTQNRRHAFEFCGKRNGFDQVIETHKIFVAQLKDTDYWVWFDDTQFKYYDMVATDRARVDALDGGDDDDAMQALLRILGQ